MSTLTTSGADEPEDEKDVTAGNVRDMYPGTQLQIADPDKYEAIIQLLARGIPKSTISKSLGCHYYVICNIEARAFPDVAKAKQLLSAKLLSAATASIDSAEKRAANGKAGALDAKLLTEAWLNINGEASQVIEINHSWPQLAEFGGLSESRVIDV